MGLMPEMNYPGFPEGDDGVRVSRSVILPKSSNWKQLSHNRRLLNADQMGPVWNSGYGQGPSTVPKAVRERMNDPEFLQQFGQRYYDKESGALGTPGVVANLSMTVPTGSLIKPGDPEWESHVAGTELGEDSAVVRRGSPMYGHFGLVNVAPNEHSQAPPGDYTVHDIWPQDRWTTT